MTPTASPLRIRKTSAELLADVNQIASKISPIFVVAWAGAAVSALGLGVWLYLQVEKQIDLRYIQSLSRHI